MDVLISMPLDRTSSRNFFRKDANHTSLFALFIHLDSPVALALWTPFTHHSPAWGTPNGQLPFTYRHLVKRP